MPAASMPPARTTSAQESDRRSPRQATGEYARLPAVALPKKRSCSGILCPSHLAPLRLTRGRRVRINGGSGGRRFMSAMQSIAQVRRPAVLLVDDARIVLRVVEKALGDAGFSLAATENAGEA